VEKTPRLTKDSFVVDTLMLYLAEWFATRPDFASGISLPGFCFEDLLFGFGRGRAIVDSSLNQAAHRRARIRFVLSRQPEITGLAWDVLLHHRESHFMATTIAPRLGDIRFSIRQLRKSPGFALTAILTLALGIGAVASVFSVVNAVLLKPFAYREPGRLVVMREVVEEMRAQYPAIPFNYLHYLRLKKDSKTLQDAAVFQAHGVSVSTGGDHPHIIGAVLVSPNFFSVLGVQPVMGRDFTAEEATKGHSSVIVLTWNGWQELFSGDPNVIGRTLRMGGEANTVIGVLPRDFSFPDIAMAPGIPSNVSSAEATRTDTIFHPLEPDPDALKNDIFDYNFLVIGRLRPGVNIEQVRAELDGLQKAHTLAAHMPIHIGIYVQPFLHDVTSDVSNALWLLFAAVGAVLLIACVNLANLQLARAVATERETAVRAALGASRSQLLMTRLAESFVLAAVGGVAGIALAFLGVRLLIAAAPANIPRLSDVQVSLPVLLFAAGLSVFTAVLFGVLPALRSLRVNPQAALQSNPSRVANTRQGGATRNLLVAAEVACTVVLLIVTGLVLRSFSQVLRQDRGFDSSHVTVAQVDLYSPQYGDSEPNSKAAKAAFIDRAIAELQQLPGVQSVGITSALPLTGETWIDGLDRIDHPLPAGEQPKVNLRWISPEYLATMRIALVDGRNISDADRASPNQVLISEKTGRDAFPDGNPVGRKIKGFGGDETAKTIIGVVADARVNGLKDVAAMVYVPYWDNPPWGVSFLVRSSQPSQSLIPEMRRVIWKIDPQVAIPTLKSLDDQLNDSVATDRFQTLLLSSFGAAALLLALLGVYGVLAYSVSLRQQEFGIRIALGSDKARLAKLVLRQAAWPVLGGAAAGLALAFVATRWVRSLLYQTQAVDPVAIGGSLVLLIGAAALAAILPARRAAQVDPIEVLRNE
jgi:predicted permease